MRILIAPDSFKGSLTSKAAGENIEKGLLKVFPDAKIQKLQIADGGEGTVTAIVSANQGTLIHTLVEGPLGEKVNAAWGLCEDNEGKFAVIEMAEASGILITPKEKRNVKKASTYGTGQLILAALDAGVNRIIMGIGGSATNDGGAGMAEALGVRFLDKDNNCLPRGGEALSNLDHIDTSNLDTRIKHTKIMIASDVDNPLCGKKGASAVYGPQKGASPADVVILDNALLHYSNVIKRDLDFDLTNFAGGGAAGGLGAGLKVFAKGIMCNGIQLVLQMIHFEDYVKNSDIVFTGEGHTDSQTAHGKAPVGIAKIAKKYNLPVICLSGGLSNDANEVLSHGIDAVVGTPSAPVELDYCMTNAAELLAAAAERSARLIKIGQGLS